MKFKIRHADKIVGILSLVAVVFLVVVIFFLGSKQRWFSKKYTFFTILQSASGVNENMAIQYKGFNVGTVDTIRLNEDDVVEVKFHIFDEYIDKVREGALVDVIVSPIGLGNQFYFYAGLGELLAEDTLIPLVDSYEGRQLMSQGLSQITSGEDNLSTLVIRANEFLESINIVLAEAGDAIIGTDTTALGRMIGSAETTLAGIDSKLDPILSEAQVAVASLPPILQEVQNMITTLNVKLNDPDGMVSSLLDADGAMFKELENSLKSLSGTLNNIEKTTGMLPAEMPQVSGLIEDLRVTIKSAEDVLESLKNNPLLKKGFTDKAATESGGNSPRNISF